MNIYEAISLIQAGEKVSRPSYHGCYISLKNTPEPHPRMYFSKDAPVPDELKGNNVPYCIGGSQDEVQANDWQISS